MISIFRTVWRSLRLILHIVLGILLTLLFSRRDKVSGHYRHNPHIVSWWNERLCHILGVEIEACGHRPQPPALIVANHVSWLDVPVLLSLTHTVFLAKAEIRNWPLVGWLAAAAGTLFIRRGAGDTQAISRLLSQRLDEDGLLTIFPEGTTTDGSDVRRFFPRLFAAAIATGAPVAPVALRYHIKGELDTAAPYTGGQSLAENLWILLRRPRTEVRVVFTPQIQLLGLERKAAAELARRAIRDALQAPCEPPQDVQQKNHHSA